MVWSLLDRIGGKLLSPSSSSSSDTPSLATRVIEVRGKAVRTAVVGTGSRTLVALHGYPDTLQVFARLAEQVRPGCRLVAVDFPGQGRSAVDVDVIAPAARAGWLVAVLDALSIDRVSLFAHDMGAMAALELALLAPARVERVVVSNALLSSTAPTSATLRVLRASGSYRFFLPAFPRSAVARCLATFLPKSAPLSTAVRIDIEQAFADPSVTSTTVAVCDAAEPWLTQGLARFASLSMPITALWGSAGGHFPREHALALPGANVVDVDGGCHWLVWQDPARVWETATRAHR
ncbi:MAG: alpha/beta hydrolase [Deltaproteobacteria bacterium]|nr:alpha/beta hydrolase [Deltaproteobacteria bacterium]